MSATTRTPPWTAVKVTVPRTWLPCVGWRTATAALFASAAAGAAAGAAGFASPGAGLAGLSGAAKTRHEASTTVAPPMKNDAVRVTIAISSSGCRKLLQPNTLAGEAPTAGRNTVARIVRWHPENSALAPQTFFQKLVDKGLSLSYYGNIRRCVLCNNEGPRDLSRARFRS